MFLHCRLRDYLCKHEQRIQLRFNAGKNMQLHIYFPFKNSTVPRDFKFLNDKEPNNERNRV